MKMSSDNTDRLRRVEFTKFVDLSGKNDLVIQGWFHRWSEKPYVVAIVEADDGKVYEVEPKRLRFLTLQIPPEYDDIVKK
jgi:predicted nucleotidyltransferase